MYTTRSIISAAITALPLMVAVPLAASASPAAIPVKCAVHSPAGNCYKPGQYCPHADANETAAGLEAGKYDVMTCELKSGRWHWIERPMNVTVYEVPCIEISGRVIPAAGAGGAAGKVISCTVTVKARNPASLGDQMVLTAPDGKHTAYNLSR